MSNETHINFAGKRIIPAPFVSIARRYDLSGDGQKVGSVWSVTLFGTFVTSSRDSPSSSGTLWDQNGYPIAEDTPTISALGSILRKQKAISDLFAKVNDGQACEIQSGDATAPVKFYATIVGDVTFQEDLWVNVCKWQVVLETSELFISGVAYGADNFSEYITAATEDIQIETNEDQPEGINLPRTYRLTHTLNATGKRTYNESGLIRQAWENAKQWATSRAGFNASFIQSSGVSDLPSYYGNFNFVRSESIGKMDGTYSLNESWVLASGTATETFNVDISTSDGDGLTTVAIQGEIQGLEQRDANMNLITSKYDNANTKFNSISSSLITRAQLYSNTSLNIMPLSTSIAKAPIGGTISFNYTYNNRPSNLISNTKSEVITINDSLNTDVIAIIGILNRQVGPILQPIGTSSERTRTLNIELVMNSPSSGTITERLASNPLTNAVTAAEIASVVASVNPATSFSAGQVYLTDNTQTFEVNSNRCSINKSWTYEV